jgi:hypothetical protein
MRLALIHVLAWLFPAFLFMLAVYVCERELNRLFGGKGRLSPDRRVRGLLGPPPGP